MKLKTVIKLSIAIFFIFIKTNSYANIDNYIIAKVDNKVITTLDIENEIKKYLLFNNIEINKDNVLASKNIALNSIIRNLIKSYEINKYQVNKYSQKDLEKYVENLASSRKITVTEFKKFFDKNNLNYNKFIDELIVELKWNTLIYDLYSKQLNINLLEVESELKKRANTNKKKTVYKISEIEIANKDNLASTLQNITKTIKSEGFVSAVLKFSISPTSLNKGSLGWIDSFKLNNLYLNELKKIKKGEFTKPIKTSSGVIFLKLDDIKYEKNQNLDLDRLKKQIIAEKKNEKLNFFSKSHFSKVENSILIVKK